MIKKGTIVVRTGGHNPNSSISEHKIGCLFKTCKDSAKNRAFYSSFSAIPIRNYRLATDEEIKLWEKGCRNINSKEKFETKSKNSIKDFSYCVGKNKKLFELYKEFCLENNVPMKKSWNASEKYYGIKDGIAHCQNKPFGNNYFFMNDLKEKLLIINTKNKKDEKKRIIDTESRSIKRGSSIISSRTRQVASSSRFIGNSTSARYSKTIVGKGKISRSVISI